MAQRRGPVKDPERFIRRCNATAQRVRERLLDDLDELVREGGLDPLLRDRGVVVLDRLHPVIRMLAAKPGNLAALQIDFSLGFPIGPNNVLILSACHLHRRVRRNANKDHGRITFAIGRTAHVTIAVDIQLASPYTEDMICLHANATIRDVAVLPTERVRRRGPPPRLPIPLTAAFDTFADQVIAAQASAKSIPQMFAEFIGTILTDGAAVRPDDDGQPPDDDGKWEDA
jgi:hypothetical protein